MIDFLFKSAWNWLWVSLASIFLSVLIYDRLKKSGAYEWVLFAWFFVSATWMLLVGTIGAAMMGWD